MQRLLGCLALTCLVFVALAGDARAQGFGLYEQNACAMGRGGAGVAKPCDDGSAIFFNPGALEAPTGAVLLIGATSIKPTGSFTADRTGTETHMKKLNAIVPHLYFAKNIGTKATVGLGIFAPFGLETSWPLDFEGRFLGYRSKVEVAYAQPTIAYRVNDKFSIGAGVVYRAIGKVELNQRADLSYVQITGAPAGFTFANLGVPRNTDFANVDLEGDSNGWGFHVGAQIKANDRVSFGARFITNQKMKFSDGDIQTEQILTGLRLPVPLGSLPAGTPIDAIVAGQFSAGGRLSPQKAEAELALPGQLVLGVAVKASEAATIFADYQRVNWGKFDEIVINGEAGLTKKLPENYKDTNGLRLGLEYALGKGAVLRGGFIANSAGAPDESVTPNLPEGPRKQYSGGLGVRVSDMIWLDAYYLRLQQSERAGRTSDGGLENPTTALNNGVYGFQANIFGATLRLDF